LQVRELFLGGPGADVENFNAHYLAFFIEIKDNARTYLFRLNNAVLIQAEVEGVTILNLSSVSYLSFEMV